MEKHAALYVQPPLMHVRARCTRAHMRAQASMKGADFARCAMTPPAWPVRGAQPLWARMTGGKRAVPAELGGKVGKGVESVGKGSAGA